MLMTQTPALSMAVTAYLAFPSAVRLLILVTELSYSSVHGQVWTAVSA